MAAIQVLLIEDDPNQRRDIELYISEFSKEEKIEIHCTAVDFQSYFDELNKAYDLMVLDFFDGNTAVGRTVLSHNRSGNRIPTLIYSALIEPGRVDYAALRTEFPECIVGRESKLMDGNNLKSFLRQFFLGKKLIPVEYVLQNEHDPFLLADIRSLGDKYIREIIYKIQKEHNVTGTISLGRMTSGLSGAIVFKIEYNGKKDILKISKETEKLKEEYKNSKNLFELFPAYLRVNIRDKYFESNDSKVFAILIEEVQGATTLFDYIVNAKSSKVIEDMLAQYFLDNYGFSHHYATNHSEEFKGVWSQIFSKLDETKFTLLENAEKELKPLLKDYNVSISALKNLAIDFRYDQITLNKETKNKPMLLCHGDLHSKNMVIQGNRATLIDTGSLGYGYWTTDICRLISHLVINAYDIASREYWDLEKIDSLVEIFNNIANLTKLEPDGKNDNCFIAVNWLIENCEKIYGQYFSKEEFQLGLIKELIQIGYRVGTIPPNRRTAAIIAASNCLTLANESFRKLNKNH